MVLQGIPAKLRARHQTNRTENLMSLVLVIILNAVFALGAIGAILALAISALRRERTDEVVASGARTLRRRPRRAYARRVARPESARAFAAREQSAASS